MPFDDRENLPTPLPVAAQMQARNTEYNLDLTGRVTHLDEKGLLTTFPVEIPAGTVLFSIIDLRTINATVRGLISVRLQTEDELGGFHTLADFVDLNPDERRKITRLHGGGPEGQGSINRGDEGGGQSRVQNIPMSTIAPKTPRTWRLNLSWLPKVTFTGLIWWLLGLIFYSIVLAGVVAIFPQGRAWELGVYHRLLHEVNHLWPSLGHLLGL
ncbi:MAG TPA: hypothetical protein VKF82_03825 [Candidatus Eremiobacteraceae bacterium]|nr:hypothetical protein [Candidatus Eremiobacteraceae bacterium]